MNTVPQEPVLSPILFNTYMQLLSRVMWSFGMHCHWYSNDIQPYYSFSLSAGEAVDVLNWYTIIDWMMANKLKYCWLVIPLIEWGLFNLF